LTPLPRGHVGVLYYAVKVGYCPVYPYNQRTTRAPVRESIRRVMEAKYVDEVLYGC